jgi:hypothetical protein
MPGMQPCYGKERLIRSIHEIMTAAAMDMNIDKAGSDIFSCRVDGKRFRGRCDIPFADGGDLTPREQYRCTREDAGWCDELTVDDPDWTHDR